jgi:sulfur carrier protein
VTIELNGERVHLVDGATVREAVASAGVSGDGRGVAVAVDGEVIPRDEWTATALRPGQRVEVLGAIQGG